MLQRNGLENWRMKLEYDLLVVHESRQGPHVLARGSPQGEAQQELGSVVVVEASQGIGVRSTKNFRCVHLPWTAVMNLHVLF